MSYSNNSIPGLLAESLSQDIYNSWIMFMEDAGESPSGLKSVCYTLVPDDVLRQLARDAAATAIGTMAALLDAMQDELITNNESHACEDYAAN